MPQEGEVITSVFGSFFCSALETKRDINQKTREFLGARDFTKGFSTHKEEKGAKYLHLKL